MVTDIRKGNDGKIYGKLFGLIETYGTDVNDFNIAIQEALEIFIITANKHGEGLEKELKMALKDFQN